MSPKQQLRRATIVSTGEELLTGAKTDTNACFIARHIQNHGFEIRRLITIGDDEASLEEELRRAAKDSDLILLSGGLGPTSDDRTRRAVARAAERDLVVDEGSLNHIRSVLNRYDVELSEEHQSQALFPSGSKIFENDRGTARGFACPMGESMLIAMPGVPSEMKGMFEQYVMPFLLNKVQGYILVRRIHLFGVPESEVDEEIGDMMQQKRNPSAGLTVEGGVVSISLRARAESPDEARQLLDRDETELRRRFGGDICGVDKGEQHLNVVALAVSNLLGEKQLTLSVAESCTGGEIGSLLVDIPGISQFLLADVVSYSNEAKISQLGVPPEQIERLGAVSPEVAESMARGVAHTTGADLGLSTTGIAGPTGGTAEKPVGLLFVGVSLFDEVWSHRLQLRGDRWRIKGRATRHALNFARLALLQEGQPGKK
ncbi:MAG: competence/damage-inducible protein A [Candidatus Brocadiia bacterium]